MKRKKLKKWMIDNNFKAKEVAEKLEISQTNWSLIVNGKSDPSFGLCEKFGKVFGIKKYLDLFEKE